MILSVGWLSGGFVFEVFLFGDIFILSLVYIEGLLKE